MYKLSKASIEKLEGVHTDLVRVVVLAIQHTKVDFTVLEGVRSLERQEELFNSGASNTMNSRHLTGHAVDLGAWVGGIRWDWPLYYKIADAMKLSAVRLGGINVEWGGDWETFKDGPHFQLSWNHCPLDNTSF
ncbi:MAG: M15 family metallopeptidase [Thiotrichaceae bacterium]